MYKDKIIKALEKATEIKNPHLEFSSRPEFGDYTSNIALNSGNPRERALSIVEELNKDKALKEIVDKIEIAGPGFINFHLSTKVLTNNLSQIIEEKDNFGKSQAQKDKTWLIEHTSPNPNKAMHLGHLRNNVLGMAISNLWESQGIRVIRDDIDNNRGIAIAKLMWGYLKYKDDKKELEMRPDRFVDELYAKASADFENPKVEKEVRQMVVDWESGDKKTWELWKKVLDYSYKGQELTLKRLGNKWDKIWHEHEHYKEGKSIVEEGLKKGIFKEGKGGAIVTDLKKYKLPDTVVIKSDGTALYITQDLALTKLKKETFKADRMFWVVGPDQNLALKQLFAVCEQLGIGKVNEFTHIAFGYMSIKGAGKMSSRKGNVIYIDDLLDQAKEEITSHNASDEVAEQIGVGAVKYSILKVGRLQDIAFDINESISFEGNSGPYLQYTYARIQSVLSKAGDSIASLQNDRIEANADDRISSVESSVLRELIKFSEIIEMAAMNYSPNILCEYLFNLAQKYNTFYNKHKIITSENENFRLALTFGVGQVLKNGLTLLGIETPKRM